MHRPQHTGDSFDGYDLDGNVDDIIKKLKDLKKKYKGRDVSLEFDMDIIPYSEPLQEVARFWIKTKEK